MLIATLKPILADNQYISSRRHSCTVSTDVFLALQTDIDSSYKAWNEPSCELSSNLYLLLLVTIMHVKGGKGSERARKEREVGIGAQLFTEIFCGANYYYFFLGIKHLKSVPPGTLDYGLWMLFREQTICGPSDP